MRQGRARGVRQVNAKCAAGKYCRESGLASGLASGRVDYSYLKSAISVDLSD